VSQLRLLWKVRRARQGTRPRFLCPERINAHGTRRALPHIERAAT
jgi:hypothetical protein